MPVSVYPTGSPYESEIVISFFSIIQEMVKHPDAKRLIGWRTRYFNKDVEKLDPRSQLYNAALLMTEELALCGKRRRSRRRMYNMACIDEVCYHYWLHKSRSTLMTAWSLFESGRYRVEA